MHSTPPRSARRRALAAVAGAALLAASGAAAQEAPPLSLGEAVARAEEGAFAVRAADGQAHAAASRATAALQGILPTLRFEGSWYRTSDPLQAFGTLLRQRTVDQADFDPRRLNDPRPISNLGAAAIVEMPLVVPEAHLGRRAARKGAQAAGAQAQWTRRNTRADVVRAYYGAVLAAEMAATLDSASRAAHAHVRQAESLVRNGMATRSDALLAAVKAGEVDAQLAGARAEVGNARLGLAVLLGQPADTAFALPGALPPGDAVAALAGAEPAAEGAARADVRAAGLALEAARADLRRARSLALPRLVSFGRYDWNGDDEPFERDASWTAGLMLQWSPFTGAKELAEAQGARGRLEAARAGAEGARAQAALERRRAESAAAVAVERLRIARDAVRQADEAHRIVALKYEGGLATVVELLDAAAAESRARLELSRAVYDALVAAAERRLALGLDPADLPLPAH